MSWWETLQGAFGYGRLANMDKGLQSSGNQSRYSDADITVTDERALSLSAQWACVRLIVNSGSTLPLALFRRDANGDREPVDENEPIARLLHRKPNPYMNAKEFRAAVFTQRVLWGNAYCKIDYRGDGEVSMLQPLKAGAVSVHRQDDGIRYEYSTETGSKTWYNRNGQRPQVFHWRGFSSDGVIGMSPLSYARHALGISVSADRYASKAFTGMPSGVLKYPEWLKPEQREQLQARFDEWARSNNHWWLLENGMDFQDTGMPPDDIQMLESRQFQVAEICRFYGVPTVMVDGLTGATSWPASYEKQVLAFLQFTLKPYLEEFEDKVLETIAPEGVYAEHNVEGFLRADSTSRANFYATALQNGWMSRAEVRRKENLPYKEGTDDLTVQLNLTPVDELGEQGIEETRQEFHINMPKQHHEWNPTVTVHQPNVEIKAPQVDVKVDQRGDVERTITEYDEQGFPKKVIEKQVT